MTEEEKKVAHMMYHHQGEKPEDIAEFFGHHQSCICKILFPKKKKKKAAKTPGRPEKLSKEQIDRLVTKKDELVTKAGGKHDVTINMVKFSARSSACTKTIRKSFKARKITWKPMRSSIILSAKDKEARLKWAKKYQKKPKKFWQKAVHANIDNKWFPIYHNGKHRDYAARRSCRGAYRGPGQSLLEVQETNWGPEKKESREAYLKRLRKTALSFSAATINKWTGDMVRRCKLLVKAKGGYIDG